MSSSGQRFRRRAMRRGYKVDEVDTFLDRVEATLNGTPIGAPIKPQDVHEVVFRVRFGGYDEWQVDLHLDRVERQLADLMDSALPAQQAGDPRMATAGAAGPDRMAPPPLPNRAGPGLAGPGLAGPGLAGPGLAGPGPAGPGLAGPGPAVPGPRFEQPRFDETFTGRGPGTPGGYEGFEPVRQGRGDMAPEARLDRRAEPPLADPYGPPQRHEPQRHEPPRPEFPVRGYEDTTGTFGAVAPPPSGQPGFGGRPPSHAGPQPLAGGPAPGYLPPMGAPATDLQRVDQLRRTFQLRRFGSGYDPDQVDRVFENVLAMLSGRGSAAISEGDLDPSRLNLVPGGYYEAEVDQAMREVRDIIRR